MRLRHRNLKIVSIWVTLGLLALVGAGWWFYSNRDARAYEIAAEAEMALRAGDLDAARLGFLQAISRKDDVALFHLYLGRTNFQAGELAAAYSAFSTASSLDPDNIEALLAVGQIGLQVGQIEASKEAARRLLLRDPNFTQAILLQGIHHVTSRDYDEAIEAADQVLKLDADSEEAVILKIRALFLNEDREAARALLEEHASQASDSRGMAMTELEVYREMVEPEKMTEVFGKLRRLFPGNLNMRLDEAHLYYKLGQRSKANELSVATLSRDDIDAGAVSAFLRLLRLYADGGEIARFVPQLQDRAEEDARIELAKFLVEEDQIRAATALMSGVSGLEARTFEALVDLEQGRESNALEITNSILEEDDSHCFSQYLRARAQLAGESYRSAIRSGQRATTECPTLVDSWTVLAGAYSDADEDGQAERIFEQGIAANPQEPQLAGAYIDWLLSRDRSREAIAVARKLARQMPAYAPAWESYLNLCRERDPACVRNAEQGLEDSREMLGMDPPPGERAAAGLFGRFLIR